MDQEDEIQMKIKLYCRPDQVFQLSVGPHTTLGEIVEALKENADINDMPPVNKLTYIDYWKTSSINSDTIVGKLVPYKQQFQIQVTYQESPKSHLQFYPDQSGFHISQKSSIMTSEILDTIKNSNISKLEKMYSQGTINEQDLQIAKQLQSKILQIQQLSKVVNTLEQYTKNGNPNLSKFTDNKLKNIMMKFFNQIKNQSALKSNDALQSMENATRQLQRKHNQAVDLLQQKNKKAFQQIAQLKSQLKDERRISQDLKKQNQDLKDQIQQLKAQNQPKKFKPLGPVLPKNSVPVSIPSKAPLYVSQILSQKDSDGLIAEFLLKYLTDFKKNEIKKTKLIYKLDELNKTNFHNYIDGKNNLLMLLQTQNNKLFGAFLQDSLSDGQTYGNAILFSVNQKLIYTKQRQTDIANSNEAFRIIIGMDDIVINPYAHKVSISKTIFKQNSSFYSKDGKNYEIFTGSSDKTEVKMQSFEVYQVFFNQ